MEREIFLPIDVLFRASPELRRHNARLEKTLQERNALEDVLEKGTELKRGEEVPLTRKGKERKRVRLNRLDRHLDYRVGRVFYSVNKSPVGSIRIQRQLHTLAEVVDAEKAWVSTRKIKRMINPLQLPQLTSSRPSR